MILFPAIDLKDGNAVRLKLGDMAQATVFNTDPAAQAKTFEQQGFEYLHVVDLDGAFAGESRNGAAVEAILAAVRMPVQLGGGIRTLAHVEAWLEKGLARVILGTVALRDPDLVKEAARRFPGQVAVGIDDLKIRTPDKNKLFAFLQQQGFKSVLTRMEKQFGAAPAATPPANDTKPAAVPAQKESAPQGYELIQDEKALQRWIDMATEQGYLAVDTETTDLTPSKAKLVGISMSTVKGNGCYIPLQHRDLKLIRAELP